MNKQLIKRIIITVLLVIIVAFTFSYYEGHKSFIEYLYYYTFVSGAGQPDPYDLRYYPEDRRGYYQFDPETILASLDRGMTDVFIPLAIEGIGDMDTSFVGIEWSQSDFLRVASALSQHVWNEPLDLDSWSVYNIFLDGSCIDNLGGFNQFDITYYKTIKTGWETVYTARHIKLIPSKGVAEWGGDGNFSTLFIFNWRKIELMKFKITADEAVRIAEKNGGKAARSNIENKCAISVYILENPNRFYQSDWYVDYYSNITPFRIFVNPSTGEAYPTKY